MKKLSFLLTMVFGLAWLIWPSLASFVQAQTLPNQAYLPLVLKPGTVCTPNAQEQAIADFMRNHPEQQRPSLRCDPILAQVARERALDMGQRAYFSHTNPDGYAANYLVEQAGYQLPDFYGQEPDSNNIESIAAGTSTPETTWNMWMNSSGHRTHILGLNSFWAEQIDYGIGYADVPGSPYEHYWVVITARH